MISLDKATQYPRVGRVNICEFLKGALENTPTFQAALAQVPLTHRPGARVLQRGLDDIRKSAEELSFKYDSTQCQRIFQFYWQAMEDIYYDLLTTGHFNIMKGLLVLGFVAPLSEPSTFRLLYKALSENDVLVNPETQNLYPMVELLSSLLAKRERVPQVKQALDEIRESSVTFILNYLDSGNKNIINFSEDILVMLIAKRLYNAMYWYMHEVQ